MKPHCSRQETNRKPQLVIRETTSDWGGGRTQLVDLPRNPSPKAQETPKKGSGTTLRATGLRCLLQDKCLLYNRSCTQGILAILPSKQDLNKTKRTPVNIPVQMGEQRKFTRHPPPSIPSYQERRTGLLQGQPLIGYPMPNSHL